MSNTLTLTLAGNSYTIPQFVLGQVRQVSILIAGLLDRIEDNTERAKHLWDIKLKTIHVALSRAYPHVTLEAMDDMLTMSAEINAAFNDVLTFSGLLAKDEQEAA